VPHVVELFFKFFFSLPPRSFLHKQCQPLWRSQFFTITLQVAEDLMETLATVGGLLAGARQEEQFAGLREATKRMLVARYKLQTHHDALQHLHDAVYIPTGETTNFKALLENQTSTLLEAANNKYAPSNDPLWQQFEEAVAGVDEQNEEQIDDDIAIEGGLSTSVARNAKCPITMKVVLELEDPVEDEVGYVYDRQAIVQMLKNAGPRGIKCPEAGTNHRVTEGRLRPATKVLAAQRKAAKAARRGAKLAKANGASFIDDREYNEDICDDDIV
jgi:E3 SUMO-protein ligase NSE2